MQLMYILRDAPSIENTLLYITSACFATVSRRVWSASKFGCLSERERVDGKKEKEERGTVISDRMSSLQEELE